MCPSDTCKIWKKGTTVRVDTTLVGFQNMRWQRGHQTLIFEATSKGHRICDINHGDKSYWAKEFKITEQRQDPVQMIMSHEMGVLHRLSSPVVSTHIDTDAISFQRQRSGIWGFRSDRVEDINGYSAKVFSAAGLNVKTDTRVEHLPESEKKKQKSFSPLQDFLGMAQNQASNTPAIEPPTSDSAHSEVSKTAGPRLTMEQYFTEPNNKEEPDGIGRPPEVTTKTQKLKASICLAENFPLDLHEQIMPIIDLMAMNTPHFAKVKDFINLQMPSGFPVRFEIPLFHVMAAKVTFGNVNGHTEPAPHVSLRTEQRRVEPAPTYTPTGPVSLTTTEGGEVKHRHGQAGVGGSTSVDPETEDTSSDTTTDVVSPSVQTHEVCTISEDCFSVPLSYRRINQGMYSVADEEEELLQLAIRQSLMEQGGGADEEQLSLKEALGDHALMGQQMAVPSTQTSSGRGLSADDEELEFALALSRQMAEEEKRKRRQEEEDLRDEELQRVLKLSLEDK